MNLFVITGRILISFGVLSLISGIIAFFPVFSYKPWFVGWSVRIASPIWSGALAVIAGVLIALAAKQWTQTYLFFNVVTKVVVLITLGFWFILTQMFFNGLVLSIVLAISFTHPFHWEASFTFAILNVITSPVQSVIAVASILLGPYCYYSFAGVSGTNYLGYAIVFPFLYGKFAAACKDPSGYEWYHLVLEILDFCSGLTIFCASLATVIKLTARLLHFGQLNMNINGHQERHYQVWYMA